MTDHTPVPNPQLLWLQAAQRRVTGDLDALGDCLDAAKTAVASGAWKGTKGDAWGKELTGRAQQLSRGADTVAYDLANEIVAQPETVCRCRISPFAHFDFPLGDYPELRPCSE